MGAITQAGRATYLLQYLLLFTCDPTGIISDDMTEVNTKRRGVAMEMSNTPREN